jgi:carboxymethylenebutenolidase
MEGSSRSPGVASSLSTEELKVRGDGRTLDVYLARPPPGPGPLPLVLVVHEIFGPDEHIRDVARRFASLGYVAAAPNLFDEGTQRLFTPENVRLALSAFASAPPETRSDPARFDAFVESQPADRRPVLRGLSEIRSPWRLEGMTEDLWRVAEQLRTRSDVDPDRVAAVGFCFGGGMAARLATADRRLAAAVVFYGQNPPLDRVPEIHAKVLGLYGAEDRGITATVPEWEAAMSRAGRSFTYHVYPGARHAFFNDTRPEFYHAESARDAWVRVQAFLRDAFAAAIEREDVPGPLAQRAPL